MCEFFFIADLSEVGRKKEHFFNFVFNPLPAKMKQNIPIINVETK